MPPRVDVRQIYLAFEGKLVGDRFMKDIVCETLSIMPEDIIKFITNNCWFISSLEDAWAFTFTGNDLKNQHLIFLSDHLLSQSLFQVKYSVAHEIGHVMRGHRNSVLEKQSKAEIRIQEKEADSFAMEYIVE